MQSGPRRRAGPTWAPSASASRHAWPADALGQRPGGARLPPNRAAHRDADNDIAVAGRIPQDFIDDLVARADIIEVVGSRVPLKKAGREYKACCPFHNEKTPSFTVSPEKGFYHCFGCGAHGTALGFLMDYERLEFVDAVEELAQLLGLEVPREASTEARSPVAPIFDIIGSAAKLYQQALREHPMAVDYLKAAASTAKGPGTSALAMPRPAGTSCSAAGRRRRQTRNSCSRRADHGAGKRRLLRPLPRSHRLSDRDQPRPDRGLWWPRAGRRRAEVPEFAGDCRLSQGRELYGLYEARRAARRLDSILVVEGYMDVVSLACHGVSNAVATLGTATTAEHLKRLFRVTPEVVFCFDGDRAGRDAAWRALQNTLAEMREGRQVRFLFLPDGEDPDSLIRSEGAAAFQSRLTAALPLSDYLLKELKSRADITTTEGMARLAELARPLLSQLPPGVYRELLTDRVAAEVKIGPDRLSALVAGDGAPTRPPRRPRRGPAPAGRPSLVRRAIQILLHHPTAVQQVQVPPGLGDARQRGVPLLGRTAGPAGEAPGAEQRRGAGALPGPVGRAAPGNAPDRGVADRPGCCSAGICWLPRAARRARAGRPAGRIGSES